MVTFIYYIFPEFVKEIPYHITQEDVDKMVKKIKQFGMVYLLLKMISI